MNKNVLGIAAHSVPGSSGDWCPSRSNVESCDRICRDKKFRKYLLYERHHKQFFMLPALRIGILLENNSEVETSSAITATSDTILTWFSECIDESNKGRRRSREISAVSSIVARTSTAVYEMALSEK